MARALDSGPALHESRAADYAEIEKWYRDLLDRTTPPDDLQWEPIKIGPTWQYDDGWILPDATLGWGFLSWTGYWLTGKGGRPWSWTPEQTRFLLWYYAVDHSGDFLNHTARLQRLKGWGKDPLAAGISAGSLHAPIVFDHWEGDRPIGHDEPDAWTQILATSADQTKNTMKLFPGLLGADVRAHYGMQVGKQNVWSDGDRRQIEAITNSVLAVEGGRPKQIIRSEIQNWVSGNGGHEMVEAIEGNAAKAELGAPARILDIFNAYRPGRDSVAERARMNYDDHEIARESGADVSDFGVMWDSLEAPPDAPLTAKDAPAVVKSIAGDATWLDVRPNGRIVKSILNPDNSPSEPIAHYEPVWTPGGLVKHGDLVVGSKVYAVDGSVANVTHVFDEVVTDSYRLTFHDGTTLDCTGTHRLPMNVRGTSDTLRQRIVTVNEMVAAGVVHREMRKGTLYRFRRLPTPIIEGTPAELFGIDPYLLGYWLGDGTSVAGQIRVGASDIDAFAYNVDRPMTSLKPDETGNFRPTVYGLRGQLTKLGVLGNKHIPESALRGSVEQRRAVLGGLIDSDGWAKNDKGRTSITVLNNRLGEDIFILAASLGLCPSRHYSRDNRFVTLTFTQDEPMARLARKSRTGRPTGRGLTLISIEPLPPTPARCIMVDHPLHQYLVTESMVPSCNSRRKWYNQITGTEDAWVDPRWVDDPRNRITDESKHLQPGDRIVLFGDGSKSRDDTGLIGVRLSDGFAQTLHWQHPTDGQLVNRVKVDEAVTDIFDTYRVVAFWFDPSHAKADDSLDDDRFWWPLCDDWHRRYSGRLDKKFWPVKSGPKTHSIAFDMSLATAQQLFQPAVTQAAEDLQAGAAPHHGGAQLRQQMKNAKRREGKFGLSVGKENRSSARKVDLAVCFIGARMLWRIVRLSKTSGAPGKGRVIVFAK